MTTEAGARMKEIVGALAPTLKDAGFRKRRHTFNRRMSDTVTHVVNFQMGSYDPPGTVEIPGLRPNLYGKFAVNLGVFSAHLHLMDYEVKNWINEYDCQLRMRLGELVTGHQQDLWWRLDGAREEVESDVGHAFSEYGLPWLDKFPTDEAILDRFLRGPKRELGMSPNAPLAIAALQIALGQREAALDTARTYLAQDFANPGHRPIAEKTVRKLGLGDAVSHESR